MCPEDDSYIDRFLADSEKVIPPKPPKVKPAPRPVRHTAPRPAPRPFPQEPPNPALVKTEPAPKAPMYTSDYVPQSKQPRRLPVFIAGFVLGALLMAVVLRLAGSPVDTKATAYSGSSYASTTTTTATTTYIGNKNSKKFHKSSCVYVATIKESNKVKFSSRSAAINAGYVGCKVCNP